MPIPESQLETWSHQGAVQTSADTYDSIKKCIESISWNSDIIFDIYLQGSYRNSTNIYGNSDVDIVVEFQSIFYSNKDEFSPEQRRIFDLRFSDGKYTLDAFRKPILEALKTNYGASVVEGNKAIKVPSGSNRLACDVICCAEYREYKDYSESNQNQYFKGVRFWAKSGEEVTNFPKLHYENGVQKNQETSTYKTVVRIFKNIRDRLISNGKVSATEIPSYFLECLIYNIPNHMFSSYTFQEILQSCISYLFQISNSQGMGNFVCQNWRRYLFRQGQWNIVHAQKFITETKRLWDGW
ncbi:MAG: nucleotidyltransferase domain-containing protein [Spirochaetota bacterium]